MLAVLPFALHLHLGLRLSICLLACLSLASAQRYKLNFVHGSSAGGEIELIQHEVSSGDKAARIERFLVAFPQHEATGYLLDWIQSYYLRMNRHADVLRIGERLAVVSPNDVDAIGRCQRAAEASKDQAAIQRWESQAGEAAERILQSTRPASLDPAIWEQDRKFAKEWHEQKQYSAYSQAIAATGVSRVRLLESFQSRYPGSKYEAQVLVHLMNAYRGSGDSSKVLSSGEKLLARDPNNLDALLMTGQVLLDRRQSLTRVLANGNRVLQLVTTMATPADTDASDWEKRKGYYTGSAHLLIGNAHVNSNSFAPADRSLRAALPYFKGNEQTEAAILFYLGWSNYHLERYKEAAQFFTQCTTMAGPFAEQANRNLLALRRERRIP